MPLIELSTQQVNVLLRGKKTNYIIPMEPQPSMEPDTRLWQWRDCQWLDGGIGFPESGIRDHAPLKPGEEPTGSFMVCVGVKVMRLHQITKEQVLAMGYPEADCYSEDEPCVCAMGPWHDSWEAKHADTALGWDADPWVWLTELEFKKKGVAQGEIS